MDVKEYISSGVLELYAMGALSADEMKEVEGQCSSHPEIAMELRKVQDSMTNYAETFKRNPPPELRTNLMSRIESSEEGSKVMQMKNPHELTYKYLIAACIASLIISTFASVFFYQKWSESEDRNVVMMMEKNVVIQNLDVVRASNEKLNHDLSMMRDPAISIITLRATDSTKYYMARVLWNKYTRQTFIDVADLPSPGDNSQYQLWAMTGGQPVDAGLFEMTGEAGMQKVKAVMDAEGWAVTLEPKGGSDTPSMDQVVLMSKG